MKPVFKLFLGITAFLLLAAGVREGNIKLSKHRQSSQPLQHSEATTKSPTATQVQQNWTLSALPAGIFKTQLLRLPPALQKETLAMLGELNIQKHDFKSLRVDAHGGLFFVCSFHPPTPTVAGIEAVAKSTLETEPTIEGVDVPISSPPIRHSRPGARNVLFLDFNGAVITRTAWNQNSDYGPTASWDCGAYNTYNNPNTFSPAEQAKIISIWERVAEDYAPFDVDVTTEQPATWSRYTGHALITPRTDKNGVHCPHYGIGGVAYLNVFGNYNYSYNISWSHSPAWINGEMTPANIAEAISHELGHNMGLSHDGTQSEEYYRGHSNGAISWAPIMGSGYGKNVTQWSKGEYYHSNQSQDDLNIIKRKLHYRPDDYGDNNASAAPLSLDSAGEVSQRGVIETTGNPDVFSFSIFDTSTITLSAYPFQGSPFNQGGNLDILMELYNEQGMLLANSNPRGERSASLTKRLPAGTYFLHIKPVGMGTPLNSSPTGYTVYGSLGQYWISGILSDDADGDGLPNDWEIRYFGNATNAVPTDDPDSDGADNLTEYLTGFDPNNSTSVFKITNHEIQENAPIVLYWNPVAGHRYTVQWSPQLLITPFINISAEFDASITSFTDTTPRTESQNFYRIKVRQIDP